MEISHLFFFFFADDIILLVEPSNNQAMVMKYVLKDFSTISSLHANVTKIVCQKRRGAMDMCWGSNLSKIVVAT